MCVGTRMRIGSSDSALSLPRFKTKTVLEDDDEFFVTHAEPPDRRGEPTAELGR